MAIEISSIPRFRLYLDGIMKKAKHHAGKVNEIILPLAGLVLWKAKEIKVREYNKKTANMAWCLINDEWYCFSYDHKQQLIRITERTLKGDVVAELNNETEPSELLSLFE
jgi:hypothetical protein